MKLASTIVVLSMTLSAAQAAQVSPELRAHMGQAGANGRVSTVVRLSRQAIDSVEAPVGTRAEQRQAVIEHLMRVNGEAQADVTHRLRQAKKAGRAGRIEQFWIANIVVVDATPGLIDELASDPDVEVLSFNAAATVDANFSVEVVEDVDLDPETPPAVNGIMRINAPLVWNLGLTGFGAVVGGIDTGVAGGHDDLQFGWRGGTNSWYDTISGSSTPIDPTGAAGGHGTHTMGTAVGRNYVGANFIGAAPGAQWIACRACGTGGSCDTNRLITCMQWMANPDGNPATDDLPDVVNNSWGAPLFSCIESTVWRPILQAWRALNIVPVFAAGNSGIPSLPAYFTESIAVGAVDRQNVVTGFSGRGPSPCDGTVYPELAAPGTKVRSAWPGGTRKGLRGTSMAAPHVAGTVALLRGYRPGLTVAEIERVLKQTASDFGPAGPDNSYGWGFVNAYRAMICVQTNSYLCTATCP